MSALINAFWAKRPTFCRYFQINFLRWKLLYFDSNFTEVCSLMSTKLHYCVGIMEANASQITSLTIVYSAVYLGADQRKQQSSASLAFVRGIHRGPGNSPHKWPVTRKMFPFDDVIMSNSFFRGNAGSVFGHFLPATLKYICSCLIINEYVKVQCVQRTGYFSLLFNL